MKMTDFSIEQGVSRLLRTGVVLAGGVVVIGGALFLVRHGAENVDFHQFKAEPAIDRLIPQILNGVTQGRARSFIQLGVLLLIATPVARVAFSIVGFAMEKDGRFVAVTATVLAILLFSLIYGVAAH